MSTPSFNTCLRRWGPAVLMMVLIFLASSIPMKVQLHPNGPFRLTWKAIFYKGGHLAGYALLALALSRAILRDDPASWPASPPTSPEVGCEKRGLGLKGWRATTAVLGLALLFALGDELHQAFVPGRSARLTDVGIDLAGAALGLAFYPLARRLWKAGEDPTKPDKT